MKIPKIDKETVFKKIRNFFYLLSQGFIGVFRNSVMSTASMLVLVCCMVIVGTFGLVVKAIDDNLDAADKLNVIKATLVVSADEETANQTKTEIEALSEGITVQIITKEEGLESLKEKSGIDISAYISGERDNPLPYVLLVNFPDSSLASMLNGKISSMTFVESTQNYNDLIERVDDASDGLMAIAFILMAILLTVALFVIVNTIKLGVFARRDEIAVMRCVGATDSFIVMPFVIEGIIIGTVSSLIAFALQCYLYGNVITDIISSYGIGTAAPFGDVAVVIFFGYLGVGLLSGAVAGGISVYRYLRD